MTDQELAQSVVNKLMKQDAFSQWLGIKVLDIKPGKAILQMKVRSDMLNGFAVCHGGVTFSLADSAFAFASNSHGRLSLAIEANISYPAKVYEGDILTASAEELTRNDKTATYNIVIHNKKNEIVGLFRGTVYRTKKEYFPKTVELL